MDRSAPESYLLCSSPHHSPTCNSANTTSISTFQSPTLSPLSAVSARSDYGEITPVDSSAGETHTSDTVQTVFASLDGTDSQSAENVQTVFTSLGGSTVLDENAYHHVTIAVDPQTDLSTLAGIGQTQNIVVLPVSGYNDQRTYILQPGVSIQTDGSNQDNSQILLPQVITADNIATESAKAEGDEFATDSEADGAIQPENSVNQLSEECALEHDDPETVNFVKPSEVFIDRNALLDPKKYAAQPSRIAFQPHKLQPPIPIVICRCDVRKNNVKSAETIFTSVQASLSKKLMSTIPGCTSSFLRQFVTQHELKMDSDEEENECGELHVAGELHKLLCLHDNLSQLVSATEKDLPAKSTDTQGNIPSGNKAKVLPTSMVYPRVITKDKAVSCDIIQPQYSRSGRPIKRKNFDLPSLTESQITVEPSSSGSNSSTKAPSRRGKRSKAQTSSFIKKEPQTTEVSETNDVSANQTSMLDLIAAISNTEAPKTDGDDGEMNKKSEHIMVLEPAEEELAAFQSVKDGEQALGISETVFLSNVSQALNQGEQDPMGRESEDAEMNSLSEKENSQGLDVIVVNKTSEASSSNSKLPSSIVLGKPRHKKDYESLAPYKFHCNICSFKSKRKSHYLKHTLVHKKSMPVLQCKECKFTTVRLSHLRRHQLTHSAQVFMCELCQYKTDDIKRLNRHYRIKHVSPTHPPVSEQVPIYACKTCEYKTLKAHQYFRHLRCHATVDGSPDSGETTESYQCPLCPYKTTKKEHYSRHVGNVHSDRRPFLCDTCGKAFKRADALRQHKVVHQDKASRSLRHTCQSCLKSFRSQAHLVEHGTIHTNKREYLCEICGASFKTRSVQRKHVLSIHQNPRSHACTSCDKRFNTKYALRRHCRTHDTPVVRTAAMAMEHEANVAAGVTEDTAPYIIQGLPGPEGESQNVTTETIATTIEEGYEQAEDGTLRPGSQTAYIQTSEANSAILYISTSLPTY